jgi:hypothetical protein
MKFAFSRVQPPDTESNVSLCAWILITLVPSGLLKLTVGLILRNWSDHSLLRILLPKLMFIHYFPHIKNFVSLRFICEGLVI